MKPPVTATLEWQGDLRFHARTGDVELTVDSDGKAGPSPVQTLAVALAGCMSVDLAHILGKARLPLRALHAELVAHRAPEDPHRVVKVDLHFTVTGDVPPDRVSRAIQLSRDKYCSVWHSLRTDIEFTTSFEVREG